MALFEDIEASIRKRARDKAARKLDELERGTLTSADLRGCELFSVRAKFSAEDRVRYIDSEEKSAISTFRLAMVQLAFPDG